MFRSEGPSTNAALKNAARRELSCQKRTLPPPPTNPDSIPKVCLISELYIPCSEHGIFSFFFLLHIIFHGADRRAAQDEDDGQVDERHQSHEHIRHIPYKAEFHRCADQHDQGGDDAEGIDQSLSGLSAAEELQSHLRVVEVPDQGSEGEQAECDRDEYGAESAEGIGSGGLHPGHPRKVSARSYAGAQEHERSGRADEDRVNEYREHLHKSLLDRVGDSRAGSRIRRGSDAGLVGEEASFDAVHDAGACEAAKDRLQVKGIPEDIRKHLRDRLIVCNNDKERDRKIEDPHHRDKDARDL